MEETLDRSVFYMRQLYSSLEHRRDAIYPKRDGASQQHRPLKQSAKHTEARQRFGDFRTDFATGALDNDSLYKTNTIRTKPVKYEQYKGVKPFNMPSER